MLIVGDWAPQKEKIHVELLDDLLILNLEGPYISEPPPFNEESISKSKKCGPILYNLSLPDFEGKILYCVVDKASWKGTKRTPLHPYKASPFLKCKGVPTILGILGGMDVVIRAENDEDFQNIELLKSIADPNA